MSENQELFYRDGTSQLQRVQAALQEDYVHIEERTIEDWLRFAQAYAQELNYYGLDNQINGDWQAFLKGEVALTEMVAFLQNPQALTDQLNKEAWLSRPHFVLFLTFLQLLDQHLKPSLNGVLQRHLDHYYRQVLKFQNKVAQPDRVFLIFDLAKNYAKERFPLPENTAVLAGRDNTGKDLIYKTEGKLTVSRAKVAQIKSVFVHHKLTSFDNYKLPEQFIPMLKLAIGQDEAILDATTTPPKTKVLLKPGANLPTPDFLGYTIVPQNNAFFKKVTSLLEFTPRELKLSFADLRLLMRLKQNRDNDENEWLKINEELRHMKSGGTLATPLADPKDFVANFTAATGHSPIDSPIYDELQSVNNVYNLYEELNFATTNQYGIYKPLTGKLNTQTNFDNHRVGILRQFIADKFYAPSGTQISDENTLNQFTNAFQNMMQRRIHIYKEWLDMQEILNNIPQLPQKAQFTQIESPKFDDLLVSKYGNRPDFTTIDSSITSIDDYFDTLIKIEQYFALFMEEVQVLLYQALVTKNKKMVYELLTKAHLAKKTVIRQQEFAANDSFKIPEPLFKEALGLPLPGGDYPPLPTNFSSLEDLLQKVDVSSPDPVGVQYISDKLKLALEDFKFIIKTCQDEAAHGPAPAWRWQRTYLLLEEAERKMRGEHAMSSPTISQLNGLYAFDDAQEATTGDQEENFKRWQTFGRVESGKLMPLGVAVSSPVLELSEGERLIQLGIYFKDTESTPLLSTQTEALGAIQNPSTIDPESAPPLYPFEIAITGSKKWLPIEKFENLHYDSVGKALSISFKLSPDFEAVQVLEKGNESYTSTEPTLRILIAHPSMMLGSLTAQDLFSQLTIKELDLKVSAQNVTPTQTQNDTSLLSASEKFAPFGNSPVLGSRFFFTHRELIFKKLDSVALNFNWLGRPSNWASHYANYDTTYQDVTSFKGKLDLFDQGTPRRFSLNDTIEEIQLFNNSGTPLILDASIEGNAPSPYTPLSEAQPSRDFFGNKRYFTLQLTGTDFGHALYPSLASRKATELAVAMRNPNSTINVQDYQVNAPYTPELQNFSFAYTASAKTNNEDTSSTDNQVTLKHIHPFGYTEIDLAKNQTFLPAYPQEGYLYLGIKDLDPPFDLSLLFRMAEGSANPEITPPAIDWRYLTGNQWQILTQKGRIITDGSNGLLNSGIVKLRIPEDADQQHELLPKGYYWLRASVRNHSEGLSDTIGIHAQAIEAVFDDQGNDPKHLETPLAPQSIKRTYLSHPELREIQQPYSSFGGQVSESLENLNTRISERLRHKNRALNIWDYERLVLEAFPQVYKVKCLPGELLQDSQTGQVMLIAVPNIGGIRPYDPFKPKLSINLLQEIAHYLKQRTAYSAQVMVKNPIYLELKIYMQVVFHPEYQADHKYYLGLLHQALQEHLAPWAFDTGADIALGGKLYPNLIVDFVEKLEYIDYINNFSLAYIDGEDTYLATQEEMQTGLTAHRADAVWVSAREHRLSSINDAIGGKYTGIGYMMVANDFTIA